MKHSRQLDIYNNFSSPFYVEKSIFGEKKKGARKNGNLFLTLKMGMEKGLVSKGWQERQPWHEDAKYNKERLLVFLLVYFFSPL